MNNNNLEPFDLERAQKGDKVVTRDGREYTFGAYNKDAAIDYHIVGWIGIVGCSHNKYGHHTIGIDSDDDLFMASNVYYTNCYTSSNIGMFRTIEAAIETSERDTFIQNGLLCVLRIEQSRTNSVSIVHHYNQDK